MRNAQRTFLGGASADVLKGGSAHPGHGTDSSVPVIVARLAEIVRAEAEVASLAAAEHALPDDVLGAVLPAGGLPRTHLFQNTVLAEKTLSLNILVVQVLLTVDKAPEVRLFALMALIKRALMHGKLFRFLVEGVPLGPKSWVLQNSLPPCVEKGLSFHSVPQASQRSKLFSDGL